MSCENTNARLQIKYTTIGGQEPTIPSTSDHNDGTWNPTDVYIGEFFLNATDELLWVRTIDGLLPVGGTGGSASFIGDFVSKANGGTYSGPVFAPTFSAINVTSTTISATAIDANTFGSSASTYYGDGSNLTGITTVWNGGTVSNASEFNNVVQFNDDITINNVYYGTLGYIDIHSDVTVSGGLSASYFIGDGSLLTNLPVGATANDYTTSAYLDGNIIRYDRTDLADAYSVDLTPILFTQSIASFDWNSSTNEATILINDGSFFTIDLSIFNNISTGVINATEVYATNFYGTFNGTQSGPSINAIISTTYEDLIISASNSTLLPGNWYNFEYTIGVDDDFTLQTFYNIFLFSLTENTLDLTSGKRVMNTPIFIDGVRENWYPSISYAVDDLVIFANRVYRNIDGGAGAVVGYWKLDSTTWTIDLTETYYKPITYDISYDLLNKEITYQRDGFGNEVYGSQIGMFDTGQNTCDISDWYNNISIATSNYSKGMWNNVCDSYTASTSLYLNVVEGFIYNNRCGGIQYNTILAGDITGNDLNTASIYNNTALDIVDNTNTGSSAIFANSITGSINNNEVNGVINGNTNTGNISYNITGDISDNNNSGDITSNTLVSDIYKNNNNGDISNNISDTAGAIYNNSNGDDISYNYVESFISFNTISGYISDNTTPGYISNNSGPGKISDNNVNGNIEYNNTGDITLNTNGLIAYNTGGEITLNTNDGEITHNIISDKIESNNNTGTISWNVSDTIAENTSAVADIDENKVVSIENNANNGVIMANVARKVINNTNTDDISFNNMTGNIESNSNTGTITYNSGVSIDSNTNGGDISNNQSINIAGNSNNGTINENITYADLSNNTVNGSIIRNKAENITSNSGTGQIWDNQVKDNISNNVVSNYLNANIAINIEGNNPAYISRNNILGDISGNAVSSISYNTGCPEGITNNTMGTYIQNNRAYGIQYNTTNGNIQDNIVTGYIRYNLTSTGDITDNICDAIEYNS